MEKMFCLGFNMKRIFALIIRVLLMIDSENENFFIFYLLISFCKKYY